jgi:phenylacetate-CoA ligase
MALRYLQHLCAWPAICRNQWMTPGELVAMQERALRRLVAHAYARVPHYRRLFDAQGLHPGNIVSLDDLRKIRS